MRDLAMISVGVWLTFMPVAFILSYRLEKRMAQSKDYVFNPNNVWWAVFCSHIYVMHYLGNAYDHRDS